MKSPSDESGSITTPTIMDQGQFEFWTVTETGIDFNKATPKEQWLEVVEKLTKMFEGTHRLHVRTMFMLGDALRFGEAAYGEDYAQAIDMTRKVMQVSEKTIKNAAWICASVDAARRRETLTLAHHEVVAALDDAEQDELLGKAESENLTVSGLKKEVKARHPETKRGRTRKTGVDLTSEEGLHHAQEKVGAWLSENKTAKLSKKWKAALEPAYKAYRRCFMGSGHKA